MSLLSSFLRVITVLCSNSFSASMLTWMRKGASGSEGPSLKLQLTKLQGFHDLAKEVIRRGVECDSKKQTNSAASFYSRGLKILQEGLDLPVAANVDGSDEVQRLVDTMERWKTQVMDRLESVTGSKPSSSSSSQRPLPSSYTEWLASGAEKRPTTTKRSSSGPAQSTPPVQKSLSSNGRNAAPRRVQSSGGALGSGGQSRADSKGVPSEVKGVPSELVRRIEDEIVDR